MYSVMKSVKLLLALSILDTCINLWVKRVPQMILVEIKTNKQKAACLTDFEKNVRILYHFLLGLINRMKFAFGKL